MLLFLSKKSAENRKKMPKGKDYPLSTADKTALTIWLESLLKESN